MLLKRFALNCFAIAAVLCSAEVNAQQYAGYTLYSVQNSTTTYLMDTASATYHTWTHASTKQTGYSSYLTPGGTLWRTVKKSGNSLTGGGMCGEIMKVDYSGTVLWDYVVSSTTECSHHDICPLPNGNVLMIVYDVKTAAQATQAGCQSAITMWSEKIIEVQPTGATTGTIVWQWNLWDHLCQDYDASKDNYVSSTADYPELWDINANPVKDMWHMNGIDYNPMLDQVTVSAHNADEYYVIDHSTTTAEAAGHTAGLSGKGGDFLYRWGNPGNYGQSGTTIFNVIHDAHWIPEGCPNEGYLVALNNKGISNTQSSVDQASPPYSGYNYSYTPNTAYTPSTYTLRHACNGYTSNMGNSEQYPNGNMLVCLATAGTIYEINSAGTQLWTFTASGNVPQAHRYTSCFINNAAPAQPTITQNGNTLTSSAATTYQWYLNGVQIPGATSQNYTAAQSGIYLVRITDSNGCVYMYSANFDFQLSTGLSEVNNIQQITIYPNPTNGILNFKGDFFENGEFEISIYDAYGRLVMQSKNEKSIDMSAFANGIYHARVRSGQLGTANRMFSVSR
ncbi:MAG: Uncharacterized protein FD123_2858 [Bacteroidetes bacterium]|nr:MAG: Uncharacterized protein FD123_2858 [Bacteroidota bacterium]